MGEVVGRLGIEADHVIFGHTHRRGPAARRAGLDDGERQRVYNTGSWTHIPGLLGDAPPAQSPYWPGTIVVVEDEGPPRLEHLLDEMSRAERAGG